MAPEIINRNNHWSEEHKARLINQAMKVQRLFKNYRRIELWDLINEGWLKSARYREDEFSSRNIRSAMIRYVWNKLIKPNGDSQLAFAHLGDSDSFIVPLTKLDIREIEQEERRELVRRILSLVKDWTNKKLIVGYYLKNIPQNIMAERYGISRKSLNYRIRYAFERVRKLYGNFWSLDELKIAL